MIHKIGKVIESDVIQRKNSLDQGPLFAKFNSTLLRNTSSTSTTYQKIEWKY